MKWRQYGRNAVLIDFAEKPDEWAFHKRLRVMRTLAEKGPPQLLEFVPGFTSVLLEFDLASGDSLETLANQVVHLLQAHARDKIELGPVREIPVHYNGPDLRRVADCNGLTIEKVIAFHSATTYKVQLLGFSPGFPYLGDLHHKLYTPRLPSPRPRVDAGSVAIGGQHTGIYSVDSPGGWNIIGQTSMPLFDPLFGFGEDAERAFALKPGDRVKFVPV